MDKNINQRVFSITLDIFRMFGDAIPNKAHANMFRSVFDTIRSGIEEQMKERPIHWVNDPKHGVHQ